MPETGLLFWMLLAFGILFFVLAKFAWPVVTRMIDKRTNYINDSVKTADEVNRQLENVKDETAKILANAQQEQLRILNEAAEMRNQIVQEAKDKAQVEAKKVIDEAKRQIQLEKEKSIDDLKRQVAELSVDIAEKVLRSDLENDKKQSEMIEKLLNEVTLN